MTTISTKSGKVIKVVSSEEEKTTLTVSDSEMDARATEAVKAAINKAKICKKPVAGYDKENILVDSFLPIIIRRSVNGWNPPRN